MWNLRVLHRRALSSEMLCQPQIFQLPARKDGRFQCSKHCQTAGSCAAVHAFPDTSNPRAAHLLAPRAPCSPFCASPAAKAPFQPRKAEIIVCLRTTSGFAAITSAFLSKAGSHVSANQLEAAEHCKVPIAAQHGHRSQGNGREMLFPKGTHTVLPFPPCMGL